MSRKSILIGTRASQLALTQTQIVVSRLQKLFPDIMFKIVKIRTRGDRISSASMLRRSGQGLFTKELERALLKKKVHMAVHSLKDMPTQCPAGLRLGAVLEREDPRDVFVSKDRIPMDKLRPGSKIGTSSLRRQVQMRKLYPNVVPVDIKGNLDTRIKKITSARPSMAGIVVARAGINRLFPQSALFIQPLDGIVPAAGQGAIAIEIRDRDESTGAIVESLNHELSAVCVTAERELLRRLEGGCQIPLGVHAAILEDNLMRLTAVVGSLTEDRLVREEVIGSVEDPAAMAQALETKMRSRGATEILAQFRGRASGASRRKA